MTVRQLLESLDSRELTEWQAFLVEDEHRAEDRRKSLELERSIGTED